MQLNKLFKIYNILYSIYQDAISNHAYDREGIINFCKTKLTNEPLLQDLLFYSIKCKCKDRQWRIGLHISLGEANAFLAYLTHNRNTTKHYLLDLEPSKTCEIYTLTLAEILENRDLLDSLVSRMAAVQPFDVNDEEQSSNDIKTFWNFEHHLEPHCIYYSDNEFLFSTHKEAKLCSSIDYGHSVLIDENGNFGVIKNKTKLLTGAPEFRLVLDFKYYYIKQDGLLAEIIQNKPPQTDDFKNYRCNILDLGTKKFYVDDESALCNSLESENFISIDTNGYLVFNYINQEAKTLTQSKPYLQIINPISYALKPVQDTSTKLWGYIDKKCNEVIKPQFNNYGFFNSGVAILKDENKYTAIDTNGNTIIKDCDFIEYEDDKFFVQKNSLWSVYNKNNIALIDGFDANAQTGIIKRTQNIADEKELSVYIKQLYVSQTRHYTSENNLAILLLKIKLQERKQELFDKINEMPIAKYIEIIGGIENERDLKQCGLWGKVVKIQPCETVQSYSEVLKDMVSGAVGYEYPVSASLFDFSKELPVVFEKLDGASVTLGIEYDKLELVNKPKALLYEQDKFLIKLYTDILQENGYEVYHTRNFYFALEYFKTVKPKLVWIKFESANGELSAYEFLHKIIKCEHYKDTYKIVTGAFDVLHTKDEFWLLALKVNAAIRIPTGKNVFDRAVKRSLI